MELKHAVDKLHSVQQEKEELLAALTALQGKLETVNRICGTKEQEVGGFKKRISNLEMERDGLFVNLNQLQDNAKLQGQADALKMSELHSEVSMYLYVFVHMWKLYACLRTYMCVFVCEVC